MIFVLLIVTSVFSDDDLKTLKENLSKAESYISKGHDSPDMRSLVNTYKEKISKLEKEKAEVNESSKDSDTKTKTVTILEENMPNVDEKMAKEVEDEKRGEQSDMDLPENKEESDVSSKVEEVVEEPEEQEILDTKEENTPEESLVPEEKPDTENLGKEVD